MTTSTLTTAKMTDKPAVLSEIHRQIKKASAAVDVMSFRERVILTSMGSVLIAMLFQLMWFDRVEHIKKQLIQQTEALVQQNQETQSQADVILNTHNNNPNVILQERLIFLDAGIIDATEKLSSAATGLVPPQQIPALLKNLISRQSGLQLRRVETLPLSFVDINGDVVADATKFKNGMLYRHGLELEVEGNFKAISYWLMAIENAPAQIQWDYMRYTVQPEQMSASPKARLILRVYTLSLQEVWLSV